MGIFADRQAARDADAFYERSAEVDRQAEEWAETQSKKIEVKQVQEKQAAVAHQAEAARASDEARIDQYSGGVPGDQNFTIPWREEVLEQVEVPPTVPRIQFEQTDYEIGPRRGTPDLPMNSPQRPPPLGALMVFMGKQLLMTMPFKVGEGPVQMERLYQIPKGSNAHVRIHTGRGTLVGGSAVETRQLPPGPGGSYGDGFPEWGNLVRDLNDIIGQGLRARFFWWFDDFLDEWGLFGGDN